MWQATSGTYRENAVDIAGKNELTAIRQLLVEAGGKSTEQIYEEEKTKAEKEIKAKIEALKGEEWAKDFKWRALKYLAEKNILTLDEFLKTEIHRYGIGPTATAELENAQVKINGKTTLQARIDADRKQKLDKRIARLEEEGGYRFGHWDGIVELFIERLIDFGINNGKEIFEEVHVCAPEDRHFNVKEIFYCPKDKIVELTGDHQCWLDNNKGSWVVNAWITTDTRFLYKYHFKKGQLHLMETIYENRDNIKVVTAILLAAALFPLFGSNRRGDYGSRYPDENLPDEKLVRDLYDWSVEVYSENRQDEDHSENIFDVYNMYSNLLMGIRYETLINFHGRCPKITRLKDLVRFIAQEIASMFHAYKIVYVTRIAERNKELDLAIKEGKEKKREENLKRNQEYERRKLEREQKRKLEEEERERERLKKEQELEAKRKEAEEKERQKLEKKRKENPKFVEFENLSKTELLELVWNKQSSLISEYYGIEYHEITTACKKHNITRPPGKFWAKYKHGKISQLHLAAQMGLKEVLELLVGKGMDVNSKGGYGETPLDIAMIEDPSVNEEQKNETIEFLRSVGAKTGNEL